MAPIKKSKSIDSLENLCIRAVLSSVIADLYLIHLLKNDLRQSLLLTTLRKQSAKELLNQTSCRLQILPGLLNDQVRQKLISEFYGAKERSDFEKFSNISSIKLDLLKVLLNETITLLDLGSCRLPKQVLPIIAERCLSLTSLKVVICEPDYDHYSDIDVESVDSLDLARRRLSCKTSSRRTGTAKRDSDVQPSRKRRKLSPYKILNIHRQFNPFDQVSSSFMNLTYVSVTHGACNNFLKELGQNATSLQELHINYSYEVNDAGIKKLCLKNPDNHGSKTDSQLHDLRVRSFHLNPCCHTLKELDIVGTCVSHYGVAFLLKHLPHLLSLGDCNAITEALEVLLGNKISKHRSLLSIRSHPARYKLLRIKEERITSQKFLLLTSLCPDLNELYIGNAFREVDLGTSLSSLIHGRGLSGQVGQLKHLKTLSVFNIRSGSVRETIKAVGAQLSSLRVYCKGLDLPVILSTCLNLSSLTLEGVSVSAPYEALESVRAKALMHLEYVKIKSPLPTTYVDLILSSSKKLKEVDISNLGEISDSRIEKLLAQEQFNNLIRLAVKKAPCLTVKAATTLIYKCPKLVELRDLSGWKISNEEYFTLQNEIMKGNFDVTLYFGSFLGRDTDSDVDSSEGSDSVSNLFDAFRNIFPVVIL